MKEHPYTELKKEFDLLQGRVIDLIREGTRQEGVLKTAVANAWKHCGEIAGMHDIEEMRTRAALLRGLMEKSMNECGQ